MDKLITKKTATLMGLDSTKGNSTKGNSTKGNYGSSTSDWALVASRDTDQNGEMYKDPDRALAFVKKMKDSLIEFDQQFRNFDSSLIVMETNELDAMANEARKNLASLRNLIYEDIPEWLEKAKRDYENNRKHP